MKSALTLVTSFFLLSAASSADLLSMKKGKQDGDRDSALSQAKEILPLRGTPYEYKELMEIFRPYLKTKEERKFYKSSLKLMFNLRPEQQSFTMFSPLDFLIESFKSTVQFIANIEPDEDFRFPEPRHPVSTITAGWQCLLKKLIKSERKTDDEVRAQMVRNALLDVLALHKTTIKRLDPELYPIVKNHAPCKNCVKSIEDKLLTTKH